ncbi:MAG: hypothetical protein M8353_02585 [ANME-2 cluster archaeon]|nr:hypothetical protein [ANME-2 cluster archaeon]
MKNSGFTFVVLIMVISLLMVIETPSSSAAGTIEKDTPDYTFPYERPGWSGDLRHGGAKCFQCHFSLIEIERAYGIQCKCHYLENNDWDLKVDIQKVQEIHGNSPCIRCHVGIVEQLGDNDIHFLHSNKKCDVCHVAKERLIRPNTTDCNVCHPNGPHGSHENLSSLCVLCHGEYGLSFTTKPDSEILDALEKSSNISSAPVREAGGIPTIADVISLLFKKLIEVQWPTI